MKLFYHQTDGGAEYYSARAVEGTNEGAMPNAILRTDGGELEIFLDKLEAEGIKLVISNQRKG